MRIGMLTGGGDCPGLNAVIRAVVRKGEGIYGHELVGFRHGWRGVIEDETMELTIGTTRGLVHRGGTILGTSRTNPYGSEAGEARVLDTLARERIDSLIVIGGRTPSASARLSARRTRWWECRRPSTTTSGDRLHVRVPRCRCVGAIDRLHTAKPRPRIVVEVMGRHADGCHLLRHVRGAHRARAGEPFDVDEVCRRIEHRRHHSASFSVVVVAEGAQPKEGTITLQAATSTSSATCAWWDQR
jgi:6-phosphofructokinase 1